MKEETPGKETKTELTNDELRNLLIEAAGQDLRFAGATFSTVDLRDTSYVDNVLRDANLSHNTRLTEKQRAYAKEHGAIVD